MSQNGGPEDHNRRCGTCGVFLRDCFCDSIPSLTLATRVVIIRHWREELTSSNSARFLPIIIPNCEIRRRGGREPLNAEGILSSPEGAPVRPLFLFPDEGARELDPDFLQNFPGPYNLIVPDGTWSQVRRVHRREAFLQGVQTVKLTERDVTERPSIYSLRHTVHPYALSTFEAVARALGVLEGKPVEESLMKVFKLFVERTLWMRGLAMPIHRRLSKLLESS